MLNSSVKIHGKSRPRVIRIQLFRNGDANFKGVVMKFETKKYTSFMTFLEDVTTLLKKNVFIHMGGVRALYDINGTKVNSLAGIQDSGAYVATCLQETFRDGPYNCTAPPQPPSTPKRASYISRESIFSSCSLKSLSKDYMQAGESYAAKKITIVRMGNRPRKIARVLLNSRNAHDFEAVLTVINEVINFDSAPMHSLYTLNGKLVCSLDEIFGRHFIFFAFRKEAICLAKDLQLSEDEVQAVMQLNKPPNSDKISLKEPPKREPESTKLLPQIGVKYDLGKMIGTGRFSSIYSCSVKMRKDDGVRYAMKISRKNKVTFESLSQELSMMKVVRHPNIVRLFHHADSSSEVYLVFELLDKDLKALLNDEGKISEDEAKLIMGNILSALFYLHCLRIVHRGVSTTNIMVKATPSGRRTAKLIDFGSACRSFKPLFEICGETAFVAPEMLKLEGYGEKVDVWAAGVVLYYMLSLSVPFLGHDEEDDKRLIVETRYDTSSEAWANISGNAKHIIGRMLNKNADKRDTVDAILSHSWITGASIDEFGNFDENKSPENSSSSSSDANSVVKMPVKSKIPIRFQRRLSKAQGDVRKVREDDNDWEDACETEAFDGSEFELHLDGVDGVDTEDGGDSCSEWQG